MGTKSFVGWALLAYVGWLLLTNNLSTMLKLASTSGWSTSSGSTTATTPTQVAGQMINQVATGDWSGLFSPSTTTGSGIWDQAASLMNSTGVGGQMSYASGVMQ